MRKQRWHHTVALMIHGLLSNSSGVTSQSNLPRLKCVDMESHSRSGKLALTLGFWSPMWTESLTLRLMHEALNACRTSCVSQHSQKSELQHKSYKCKKAFRLRQIWSFWRTSAMSQICPVWIWQHVRYDDLRGIRALARVHSLHAFPISRVKPFASAEWLQWRLVQFTP